MTRRRLVLALALAVGCAPRVATVAHPVACDAVRAAQSAADALDTAEDWACEVTDGGPS